MLQGPRMNPRGMPNRFQGPRMMGGPGMGQRQMYSNPFAQGPMMPPGQMPRMGGRNMRSSQGGGLLSKILGRGTGQQNGPAGFLTGANTATRGAGSGGGILKSLADPSALSGFLTNTQKVLNTAQQFGPMVQQYGPLVRNLPSMWKLYRGLKDLPDADEQTTEAETDQPEKNKNENKSKSKSKNKKKPVKAENTAVSDKPAQKQNGASTPKLFI
jgi:hypothetical protein